MSVTVLLIEALAQAAPVTAMVGNRIYAGRSPQEATLPHLVVAKTSEAERYDLEAATGYCESRVVVVCRAALHGQAEALGSAVVAALRNYSAPGVTMQRDLLDRTDAVDVAGKPVFLRTLAFVVWHQT